MIKNNPQTKFTTALLGCILLVILATPFAYVYFAHPDGTFWDNAMGNMLATVLALIAGIPTALWIDRLAKSRDESQKHLNERKREKEILELIKEELNFSYESLFLPSKKGNISSITIQQLKSDLWGALMASEEIKYIEDPKLLNRISSAYYVLRMVKDIEWQAYIALRTSAIVFTETDGTKSNATQHFLKDARTLDILFENSIKEALRVTDERLIVLQNYEN